ncbi:ankyrin repeat-containing domain protein [Xylaria telfairii]|nr:ankyrin repeat-containing domain protein [Xylaria telfairii]
MILERFEQDEEKLLDSFGGLWNIFLSVASGYKGEIICILDALDECEESGRSQMTKNICKLHETDSAENSKFVVKFLLTSRPYIHIRREFQILENRWPTIHLSGENEVEVDKISAEIDIVIKSRVGSLSEKLQLQPEEQQVLQDELTRVPNRTYLWVYLMFDVIEDIISVTEDNLRETIRCVPGTLDAAYERILSKTRNREKAMRLLHIVVAAYRPLSLKEMALALAIKEHHRSYIDLKPEPEDRFRQTVRELCGLFVTIIDSKIYLLHQTAREFLVQQDYMNTIIIPNLQWKSSLRLEESDRIVAEICIWYLLFDEFKSSSQLGEETATQYTNNYIFVSYSAENWNHHFKWAVIGNDDPMQHLALRLFDEERRRVWFEIFRVGFSGRPYPTCFDALILASYFGIESIVKLSLEEVANVDLRDTGGRTPLWWTAYRGYDVISALLLKNGADIEAKDNENGWTPLYSAANCGNEAVCKLLLENGADIEAKDNKNGWTPLYSAADCGNEAICKLLLENGADIEAKDNENGWTPLYSAGNYGNEAVCKLLLERSDLINEKDNNGNTALHLAVDYIEDDSVRMAVITMLLKAGASITRINRYGRTPLGRWETIKHWHRFMSLQIEYWETFRGARCQARGLGVITWRNRLRLKARRRVFRR